MSKLRKVLEENFRHNKAGLFSQDAPESEILKLEKIAITTLEKEIKQEIISEETKRILEENEKARLIRNIDRIKDAFWTVVVIGILVGVTGNQVTELIAFLKTGWPIGGTLLVAVALIVIMYSYFWTRYLKQAANEIREFREKK